MHKHKRTILTFDSEPLTLDLWLLTFDFWHFRVLPLKTEAEFGDLWSLFLLCHPISNDVHLLLKLSFHKILPLVIWMFSCFCHITKQRSLSTFPLYWLFLLTLVSIIFPFPTRFWVDTMSQIGIIWEFPLQQDISIGKMQPSVWVICRFLEPG